MKSTKLLTLYTTVIQNLTSLLLHLICANTETDDHLFITIQQVQYPTLLISRLPWKPLQDAFVLNKGTNLL